MMLVLTMSLKMVVMEVMGDVLLNPVIRYLPWSRLQLILFPSPLGIPIKPFRRIQLEL